MKFTLLLISLWLSVHAGTESETSSSVKHTYQIQSFEFKDGPVQSTAANDFDYDPYTGFLCAAFKRRVPTDNFATIACFDTTQFKQPTKPVFSAFPSLMDNTLPDQMTPGAKADSLNTARSIFVDEEEFVSDKPVEVHNQRLYGGPRNLRRNDEDEVVSHENLPINEGNENAKPNRFKPNPLWDPSYNSTPALQRKLYHFISVSRIHFDDCGRMWLLDSGSAFEGSPEEKFYRRPILWAFDMAVGKDRKLVHRLFLRHEITSKITHNGISDFAVDIHGKRCHELHVYMANNLDNNIIVYDNEAGEDYVVEDDSLHPIKSEAKHVFLGQDYQYTGGVFSLALGELNSRGYREVFFTLASGMGQYVVNSKTLHHKRTLNSNYFHLMGYRGCGVNTLNHVYDSLSQVIFYMHPETKSVRCFNTNKRLVPENIGTVFVDEHLSTGWSMKVDQANNLWFMSNDFNFFTDQPLTGVRDAMNIYRGKIRRMIQNTVCDFARLKSDDIEKFEELTVDDNFDGPPKSATPDAVMGLILKNSPAVADQTPTKVEEGLLI